MRQDREPLTNHNEKKQRLDHKHSALEESPRYLQLRRPNLYAPPSPSTTHSHPKLTFKPHKNRRQPRSSNLVRRRMQRRHHLRLPPRHKSLHLAPRAPILLHPRQHLQVPEQKQAPRHPRRRPQPQPPRLQRTDLHSSRSPAGVPHEHAQGRERPAHKEHRQQGRVVLLWRRGSDPARRNQSDDYDLAIWVWAAPGSG